MNFNDLPNDILGMIYDMKEAEQHLSKIEKYSRSNFKFVMKDIKEKFEIILDDKRYEELPETVSVSEIVEYQEAHEDNQVYDAKWKFDDMTAWI